MEEQRERAREAAKKVPIGAATRGAVPPHRVRRVRAASRPRDGSWRCSTRESRESPVAQEGEEVRLPRPDALLRGGRRPGRRPRHDPHRAGVIRVTDAQWAGRRDRAHGRRGVRRGPRGRGGPRRGRRARREATARAHTATHVVHWTLKHLLGEHARQAGSLVAPGRLRFDFPHPSAVPRDVLEQAEARPNRRLAPTTRCGSTRRRSTRRRTRARSRCSARSTGTSCASSRSATTRGSSAAARTCTAPGNIALVRILHEGSIGAGMRRVEALVGPDALREINVERELLQGLVPSARGTGPAGRRRARAPARRARQAAGERAGQVRKGDAATRVDQLVGQRDRGRRARGWSASAPGRGRRRAAGAGPERASASSRATAARRSSWAGPDGKALLVAACTQTWWRAA